MGAAPGGGVILDAEVLAAELRRKPERTEAEDEVLVDLVALVRDGVRYLSHSQRRVTDRAE